MTARATCQGSELPVRSPACHGPCEPLQGRATAFDRELTSVSRNVARPGRRGARVADWAGLENRCAGNRTVSSNLTLSARLLQIIPLKLHVFL
jgi:hypothetical protein